MRRPKGACTIIIQEGIHYEENSEYCQINNNEDNRFKICKGSRAECKFRLHMDV